MIALEVEVPIAGFRQSRAREYAETYPVPPPSTVYGMMLSTVGEMNRDKHAGIHLAIAMLSEPEKSTLLRTFRRFKKKEISDASNARPDYQELLTDIRFRIYLDEGKDANTPTLKQRLQEAFEHPEEVNRFGGLCLGESRDLVNSVTLIESMKTHASIRWLVQDADGVLTLPYWVDHVGSQRTRWLRYSLQEPSEQWEPPIQAWTEIFSG